MMADFLLFEAIAKFDQLFAHAQTLGLREPGAMMLATAGLDGRPSVRTVLLRGYDPRGFVFYTNSTSRKGRELHANPQAAICFYWDTSAEQFRAEGHVERVNAEENDAYWQQRPRDRQLGAWASEQSAPLDNPESLTRRFAEMEQRFTGREVPRPEHWFGFRIVPDKIEFWSNRAARLHERIVYEARPTGWIRYLLYP